MRAGAGSEVTIDDRATACSPHDVAATTSDGNSEASFRLHTRQTFTVIDIDSLARERVSDQPSDMALAQSLSLIAEGACDGV